MVAPTKPTFTEKRSSLNRNSEFKILTDNMTQRGYKLLAIHNFTQNYQNGYEWTFV